MRSSLTMRGGAGSNTALFRSGPSDEAHLPALQDASRTAPRISRPQPLRVWPRGVARPPRARPQAAFGLGPRERARSRPARAPRLRRRPQAGAQHGVPEAARDRQASQPVRVYLFHGTPGRRPAAARYSHFAQARRQGYGSQRHQAVHSRGIPHGTGAAGRPRPARTASLWRTGIERHAREPAGIARKARAMTRLMRRMVRGYQYFVSPMLGAACRFHPSCSQYADEALARHGALRGSWLTAARLCRCGPWHPGGFDPVPERKHR